MTVKTNHDTQRPKHAKRPSATPVTSAEEVAAQPSVLLLGSVLEERPFDDEARQNMIAEAAYFRAAQRGFEPGSELDDWLAAEAEVNARLCGS
jgi:hypothetical protein